MTVCKLVTKAFSMNALSMMVALENRPNIVDFHPTICRTPSPKKMTIWVRTSHAHTARKWEIQNGQKPSMTTCVT